MGITGIVSVRHHLSSKVHEEMGCVCSYWKREGQRKDVCTNGRYHNRIHALWQYRHRLQIRGQGEARPRAGVDLMYS